LVFDVSKWDLPRLACDPREHRPVLRVNHPERGEISIEETAEYDAAEQIRRVVWYLSAPDEPDFQVIDRRLRVIFPQELIPRQVCVCL
jgi:hypothetical protein